MTTNETEDHLSYAGAGRLLGRTARAISVAVFAGKLDASRWPIIAGRKVIPASELPEIARILATDRRRKTP